MFGISIFEQQTIIFRYLYGAVEFIKYKSGIKLK